MIKIDNLSKSFGDNLVLNNINQTVDTGQCVAIIGPSGSGKSTLMRCINRIEIPSGGTISLDGRPIDANSKETISGMVFQDFNLFPHLRVIDNLTIAPVKVKKISLSQATNRGLELLDEFGLANKANEYPRHLSGGQRQRVAIAREMAMNPKILLFDEPTSALDPQNVDELITIIQKLKQKQITIFVVTHNIEFASRVADQIWFMRAGEIVAAGPTKKIISQARSDPSMATYFENI